MVSIEDEKLYRDKVKKIKEAIRRHAVITERREVFNYSKDNKYELSFKPFGNGSSELIEQVYARDIAGCPLRSTETFKYDETINTIYYNPNSKYNVGSIEIDYSELYLPYDEILDILLDALTETT